MRVGIISDTHGHTRNTLEAVDKFRAAGIEQLIHCGDIGSPAVVELLGDWPTHFVLGNVDQDVAELQATILGAGHKFHDRFGSVEFESKRIAFLHGDDSRRWHATVNEGTWDLLCYGHTHKAELRRMERTLILNPGAVFRANPRSIAVVTLPEITVEFLKW
jgi:putative phosphoesterase